MYTRLPTGAWPTIKIFINKLVTKLYTQDNIITVKMFSLERCITMENLSVEQNIYKRV